MGWEYARPGQARHATPLWWADLRAGAVEGECYKFSSLGWCWLPLVFIPAVTPGAPGSYVTNYQSHKYHKGDRDKFDSGYFTRSPSSTQYKMTNGDICWVMLKTKKTKPQSVPPWRIEWHAGVKQLCIRHCISIVWNVPWRNICADNTDSSPQYLPAFLRVCLRWESLVPMIIATSRRLTQCQAANENCHFPATTKLYFIPRIENRH